MTAIEPRPSRLARVLIDRTRASLPAVARDDPEVVAAMALAVTHMNAAMALAVTPELAAELEGAIAAAILDDADGGDPIWGL